VIFATTATAVEDSRVFLGTWLEGKAVRAKT